MKLYLLFALAAILSVGAGFGTGSYLKGAADAAATAEHVATSSAEEAEPVILEMGRMNVPIYHGRSITYVLADINIAVADGDKAELVKTHRDAVRALMLETMVEFATSGKFGEESIDQKALSEAMEENINRTFGLSIIDDVLFASLVKQAV